MDNDIINTRIVGFDPASFRNLGWSIVDFKVLPNEEANEEDSDIAENDAKHLKLDLQFKSGTLVIPDLEFRCLLLWHIFSYIDNFLTKYKPDIVVIEQTNSFRGGFITGQVSECIGSILAACGRQNMKVVYVSPSHVKKVITGNGRATKSQMKHSVKQKVFDMSGESIKFDSEHSCDATANVLCWLLENKIIRAE